MRGVVRITIVTAIFLPYKLISGFQTPFLLDLGFAAVAFGLAHLIVGGIAGDSAANSKTRSSSTGQRTSPSRQSVAGGFLIEGARRQPTVEEMFAQAAELDRAGEWERAVWIYQRIADRLPHQPNGKYARKCAQEMRAKIARYRVD